MIGRTLTCILTELNAFVNHELNTGSSADKVVFTNLLTRSGTFELGEGDAGCSLVNIEEERVGKSAMPAQHKTNGTTVTGHPAVKLNLSVLFSVNYAQSNYASGLELLSLIVAFFQQKPHFTLQNTPGLPEEVEKLSFDIVSLPLEDVNNLWGMLGGTYLPSIVYKIRLLPVGIKAPLRSIEPVTEIETNAS